ncbi:hypothetical protein [Streptomyces sp. NL15-2K]|uniref:hypothetical protein n=1 Tax=Streptomyces sp. NL15-2K TaxID=376149 RepID=UPI000F57672F|nr:MULTISPECIES: hypothetical protein [Actinomycetes]WKX14293.1 hypothetical protein Q4V64_44990 [Kutzneria buriramensis]
MPVLAVLHTQWKDVLPAGGTFIGTNSIGHIFMAYVLSYATTQLGFARDRIVLPALIAAAVWPATIPWVAALSDRLGRRKECSSGPARRCCGPRSSSRSSTRGRQRPCSPSFAARLRCGGVSLGYRIGAVLGGGSPRPWPRPVRRRVGTWPITGYPTGVAALSLGCQAPLTRTRAEDSTSRWR